MADLLYKHVPKEPRKNLLFRREIGMRGFKDAGFAKAIHEMCAEDILFYINVFGVTYDPRMTGNKALPFITYEFQDEMIGELNRALDGHKSEDILIEKSRDMGVSWISLVTFEHRWHFKSMESFLLGSRTEDYVDKTGNAKALFWKIDFFHKHQPKWLLPTGRHLGGKDPNRTHMHLENADNGSVIDGEASGKDFGRGDRRTGLFLDEFAADAKGSETNASCADTSPVRIFNSTPQGTGNEFYVIRFSGRATILTYHWSLHPEKSIGMYKSNNGLLEIIDTTYEFPKNYKFICDDKLRSPWYDHEDARRAPWQTAQELDINYEGAGKQFYNIDLLDTAIREKCHDPMAECELIFDFDSNNKTPEYMEQTGGRLKLWCMLDFENVPDRNANYSVGCDIATGKGGTLSTNSVASVTNCLTGEQVAEFAVNTMSPEEFAEHCVAICRFFHGALLTWEDNGPGGQFGKKVDQLKYPYIYYRRSNEKSKANGKRHTPGWWSNAATKRELLSGFGEAIRKGQYIPRSAAVMSEAKGYVFEKGRIIHSHAKTSASPDDSETGDNHGDRVIAAALSVHGIKEKPVQPADAPSLRANNSIPENCMAARMRRAEAELRAEVQEIW